MDQNKIPLEPHHLGVTLGASKTISEPMVCLAQTVHLSCTDTNTISKRTETRFHRTHVSKEFNRCVKTFSERMVRLAQIMHLSCVKIRTTSKRTKMSFHLSLVT